MYSSYRQTQSNRYGGNATGKAKCIFFPEHELDLIQDLNKLAHEECVSESQWVRRRIREHKRMQLQATKNAWDNLVGQK